MNVESGVHRLVVVGAGIAGASLCYELARLGLPPLLIDAAAAVPAGASAVPSALLNPFRGRSGKPGPLDLDGLNAFWRLIADLEGDGLDPGAKRGGVLRVASNAAQARSWRSLQGQGLVELDEAPAPYRAPQGAFLAADGGWVDTSRLLESLLEGAGRRGGQLLAGTAVRSLEPANRGWLLQTESGGLQAQLVVLSTGSEAVAGARVPPLVRVAGDMVVLRSQLELPHAVAGPVYFSSDGDRVYVGGNHRDPHQEDPKAPELLRSSAARVVPGLADAPIDGHWSGVRARTEENLPLSIELEPGLLFLGGFGGRGFLTGPLLARRLASRIAAGMNATQI